MPEMKHPGGEISVLATHAGMQQSNKEIGILEAPAAVSGVEAIHAVEIVPPDRKVAGPRAAPGARPQLAQRSERDRQQRREAVDLALSAQAPPSTPPPPFGLAHVRPGLRVRQEL